MCSDNSLIKVGLVIRVEHVNKQDHLLKVEVDIKEEENIYIYANIRKWINIEDLVHKKIMIAENPKKHPRRYGILTSQDENEKVIPVFLDNNIKEGTVISFSF